MVDRSGAGGGRPAEETGRDTFVGGTKDHCDICLGLSLEGGW